MDGNGGVGPFLINVMLAAGGYPRTVIPAERRDDYKAVLETASTREEAYGYDLAGNRTSLKKRDS